MIFRPKPCCPAFLSPCPSPSGPCAPWQEQGWPRKLSPAVTVTKQRGDGYRKPLMAHTVAVGPCHAAQEMVKQDGLEPGQPQAGEGPPLMTLLGSGLLPPALWGNPFPILTSMRKLHFLPEWSRV